MRGSTDTDPGGGTAAGADDRWTLTFLMRSHPRVTAASIAVVVVLVAVTLLTTFSDAPRQPLSDSASCSQWAAATAAQQTAYAHVYINEYGRVANTARNAAAVRAAIDSACTHAAYLDEASDITVLAGMRHAF